MSFGSFEGRLLFVKYIGRRSFNLERRSSVVGLIRARSVHSGSAYFARNIRGGGGLGVVGVVWV